MKPSVLIVEDEGIIARYLESCLTSLGYRVAATTSEAEHAIDLVARVYPDVVLMDIRLSGEMGGIEAASRIRARYDIPIIFLSAHSDQQALARAKITEPNAYLLKPFNVRELHAAIEIAIFKSRAERELEQSRRLAMLGLFAAGLAHELNNPLASMRARLQRMRPHVHDPFLEESVEVLDGLVSRMSRVLKRMAAFARAQEGGVEACLLHELLKECAKRLAGDPRCEAICIELDLRAPPLPVLVNRAQIEQVFTNLGLNAIEAMPNGGRLVICLDFESGNFIIRFSDTGNGIDPTIASRLFEPFVSGKESETGMGLGLFLARTYVEAHGGRLEWDPTYEDGASFLVRLPYRDPDEQK